MPKSDLPLLLDQQVLEERRRLFDLHALGYRPPAEFERALLAQRQAKKVECRSSL
jgi:hypothetical protein